MMLTPEAQARFRPRRRHRKSRNGCLECKRRRIKCDEVKPSCGRCILTMQPCIYATSPLSPTSIQHPTQQALPTDQPSLPTPSPHTSPSPPLLEKLSISLQNEVEIDTTDSALYHHYLTHTSATLTTNPRDHHAIKICLPTLALKSKTVYHSLLALSAACLCCDMIYSDPPPDVSTIKHILMTGYRHYNLASKRLREFVSRPSASNAEPLLAAPPVLVPFVTAAQQINHWISRRDDRESFQEIGNRLGNGSGIQQGQKLLSSTPRDVIVISRGISATIRALEGESLSPRSGYFAPPFAGEEIDSMDGYTSPGSQEQSPAQTPPSHKHPMYHIIARTSESAFSKLQDRIDSALFYSSSPNEALSACAEAFAVLSTLRSAVFPPSPENPAPLPPAMTYTPTLPQIPPWLSDFTARPSTPSASGYMTRPFLSFLVQAPQAYLDLVLPLLDKRTSTSTSASTPPVGEIELSVEEALTLDIYAHWSVLMILVGEESWWIGTLPDITLSGMVNRFGVGFVKRFWPDTNTGSDGDVHGGDGEWWPGSMLRVEREVGRYRR